MKSGEGLAMVFFSIIVPIYNVAKYLHQCLDSILSQSYSNYEVILVDDGSTDGSAKICDEYATINSSFHVIHQVNQGVCIARKVGIQKAKGDYVCWVDGDDYIENCFLENIKKITDTYSPDVVTFGLKRVDKQGAFLYTINDDMPLEKLYLPSKEYFYGGLIYDYNIKDSNRGTIIYGLCTKAIKRPIIERAMLEVPDQVRYGEDMAAVMLALCRSKKVYVSKLCDYYYRWNPISITNTVKEDDFQRKCALFSFLNQCQDLEKIPQRNIDAYAFNHILSYIMSGIKKAGKYREYRQFVNESLTDDLNAIISRTKLPRRSFKSYIISFMVKHRMYGAVWISMHTRKKIIEHLKQLLRMKKYDGGYGI